MENKQINKQINKHQEAFEAGNLKLSDLEKEYGQIKVIQLDGDDEGNGGKVAYLRKPDRFAIKYAKSKEMKLSSDSLDMISSGEVILQKCMIAGDQEIINDDKYFFRACTEAYKYLNEVTGFLQS